MNAKKYAAEAIGTFWLTFAGCGSAVIAAGFPQVGIGLVGVSLAFGLSVVTMAYAIGHVSGCHLNPAVTVGLAAGGRFPAGQIAPYIIAQLVGAIAASALLYVIASGAPGFDLAKGFASNGYGPHSPGQYGLMACFLMEVVMTMMFLFIIMGATQNSQSWPRAHPPTNKAGPVLRAGFTEVLVTGMLTRWIIVSVSPIASGAKPAGALPCVAPMMMNRNIAVMTTSVMKQTAMPYWPGECAP